MYLKNISLEDLSECERFGEGHLSVFLLDHGYFTGKINNKN